MRLRLAIAIADDGVSGPKTRFWPSSKPASPRWSFPANKFTSMHAMVSHWPKKLEFTRRAGIARHRDDPAMQTSLVAQPPRLQQAQARLQN